MIDGADEVDPELNVVKGRGGALLREKVCCLPYTLLASSFWRLIQGLYRLASDSFHVICIPRLLAGGNLGAKTDPYQHLSLKPCPAMQMVELASDVFVCIVDESKLVDGLGGSKGNPPSAAISQ